MAQPLVQIPKAEELIAKIRAGREASAVVSTPNLLKNLSKHVGAKLSDHAHIKEMESEAEDLSGQ